jgi:hypothetical protein
MDLEEVIPLGYRCDKKWNISGEYLRYKKFENLPLASISESNIVMVYLDHRMRKECLRLIKHLLEKDYKFYLIPPYFTNPKINQEYDDVIEHYLYTHSEQYFFDKFPDIGFDLVSNLVTFCRDTDTMTSLKTIVDNFRVKVNATEWDIYTNKLSHIYSEGIRNEFDTMFRSIRLKYILS